MPAARSSIAHLVQRRQATPVVPVYLRGPPKGETLFCDVFVAGALRWRGHRSRLMGALEGTKKVIETAAAER